MYCFVRIFANMFAGIRQAFFLRYMFVVLRITKDVKL